MILDTKEDKVIRLFYSRIGNTFDAFILLSHACSLTGFFLVIECYLTGFFLVTKGV
jgi:hypothetical protein